MRIFFVPILLCVCLAAVTCEERGILDVFGLGELGTQLNQAREGAVAQLTALGTQLLFSGRQKLGQAREVFGQLRKDLTEHATNGGPYVQNAIQQLQKIVKGDKDAQPQSRGILDNLGFGDIAKTLGEAKNNSLARISGLLTSILFQGRQKLGQAREVLLQLRKDLKEHATNGGPYVQNALQKLRDIARPGNDTQKPAARGILDVFGLGELGTQLNQAREGAVAQLTALGTQLLFSGRQKLGQAREVFGQLRKDLTEHATNGGPYVQNAIQQLQKIVKGDKDAQQPAARGILDVFGLGELGTQLNQAREGAVAQLTALGTQLLFSGRQKLGQAREVFGQLRKDLTEHATNGGPYVQNAIQQLQKIVKGDKDAQPQSRGVLDNLGFGDLARTLGEAKDNALSQITGLLTSILFQGRQKLGEAGEVLKQLRKDLREHATNGGPYIQNAIQELRKIARLGDNKQPAARYISYSTTAVPYVDEDTDIDDDEFLANFYTTAAY